MSYKEIQSLQHPLVKHLAKLYREKKYRDEKRCIAVEGEDALQEAAKNGEIATLLATDRELLAYPIACSERYLVSPSIIKKITGHPVARGVIAEVATPVESVLNALHSLVILDGVQDPGNVGAIIRSALAFGWEGLYLVEGCCDPWNDKVVRASKAALFSLPYRRGSWRELRALIEREEMALYAADMEGTNVEEVVLSPPKKIAVAFGNEGGGLSDEAREGSVKVSIPLSPDMESLNVAVAAGIVLYRLKKGER